MKHLCAIILILTVLNQAGFAQIAHSKGDRIVVLKAVLPIYPDAGILLRQEGDVIVSATLNDLGDVVAAKGPGQEDLVYAAEQAAKKWKFTPAKSRTFRKVELTFRFVLSKENDDKFPETQYIPPYTVQIAERDVCLTQHKSVD